MTIAGMSPAVLTETVWGAGAKCSPPAGTQRRRKLQDTSYPSYPSESRKRKHWDCRAAKAHKERVVRPLLHCALYALWRLLILILLLIPILILLLLLILSPILIPNPTPHSSPPTLNRSPNPCSPHPSLPSLASLAAFRRKSLPNSRHLC